MSDIESLGKKRKRDNDSVEYNRDEESEAKKVNIKFDNFFFYFEKKNYMSPLPGKAPGRNLLLPLSRNYFSFRLRPLYEESDHHDAAFLP